MKIRRLYEDNSERLARLNRIQDAQKTRAANDEKANIDKQTMYYNKIQNFKDEIGEILEICEKLKELKIKIPQNLNQYIDVIYEYYNGNGTPKFIGMNCDIDKENGIIVDEKGNIYTYKRFMYGSGWAIAVGVYSNNELTFSHGLLGSGKSNTIAKPQFFDACETFIKEFPKFADAFYEFIDSIDEN